ncbi:polysaccharide biosynthesis/export family protein [Acetobacter sacchari]|uniref:polysaccharide biosynthesis/export family protein n=1 Tax=Acetobacter sacchari TaxID=2661687 RepID=UPI001FAED204|nr:polysaccharide biosynthesis/export family protein [Acetobacter sacchari]
MLRLSPAALLAVAACSTLPDSGPTESVVLHAAKDLKSNPLGFAVLPITPSVAATLAAEVPPLVSSLDTTDITPTHNDRIGAGDVLAITVFELGSGLFSSGSTASAAQSSELNAASGGTTGVTNQTLPPTEVETDGSIAVPYVGRIQAAGMTPQTLAALIQARLGSKSQNAQVMVRIASDVSNTVIVSGEVHKPGRVMLSTAQERLSDLVAIAGGAIYPPEDTHVQLVRRDRTAATDLGTLETYPREDIRARPGDRIHVIYQPRSYTVFGAAGKEATETPFKSPHVSLAEALARSGGPADSRADPNAVFLFRFETPEVARSMGVSTPVTPQGVPIVYQLDMMSPTSYFLAQRVPLKGHDLLLLANAKTNRFYKFNQLIGALISPAITAAWVAK